MKQQTQTKKLNEVAEVKSGFAFKSSEFVKQGIPIIRISNITNGQDVMILEKNQHYYNKELDERTKNSLLQNKDILIALSGATTGKIGIYKDNKPALLNQRIALIRAKDKKSNDYIYYFLQTKSQQILKEAYGGAQPNISPNSLKEYEIYYPKEFEDRQKIVSAIETQFTRLDDAVKSLKAVKQKIQLYKKAVLKKAFEKEESWESVLVKDMGNVVTGKTPKTSIPEYYGEEYCFFRPKELDNGKNVNDSKIKLSKKGFDLLKKLPEKSVMVTCIGATIGKTGFNRIEGATNQQINSIIVNKNKFVPEFLYYLFISEIGQRNIIDNSSSTTLPILNKGRFEKLKFILPHSLPTQSQIVSTIESSFSVIDKVEEAVDNSLKKAEQLRKSILKVAFEGRLVK